MTAKTGKYALDTNSAIAVLNNGVYVDSDGSGNGDRGMKPHLQDHNGGYV